MSRLVWLSVLFSLLLASFPVLYGCTGIGLEYSNQDMSRQDVSLAVDPADLITRLEAQSAPDGINADIWEKLTAELVRVLADREITGKQASDPPRGGSGAVTLEYIPATMTLEWLYVNTGDYDQNGVVGISDLTPLGLHFGETSEGGAGQPFDPTMEQWVIDGDSNGVIDLGDITPIGANFGVTVEGYRIYYSDNEDDVPAGPDLSNGPGTTGLDTVPVWSGDEALGRKRFTHQVSPGAVSRHHWLRPYHGAIEGSASNSVTVSSQFPVADLAADVTEGHAPLHVTFDASGSTDPDGSIVRYDYDFDSNGTWDAYDSGSSVSHNYIEPDVYNAMVRVTDDDWHQDTAVLTITVTEPPNQPPVADLVADVTEGDVPLNVIFNAGGSTDPDGTIVSYDWDFDGDGTYDASGSNPTYEHLYEDYGEFTVELKVTDDDGASDTTAVDINVHSWVFVNLGGHGRYSSLAEINGHPAIVGGGGFDYRWSTTATGANIEDWQSLDFPFESVGKPKLVVVEGNPAICFSQHTADITSFARSSTSTGTDPTDWQAVNVGDHHGSIGSSAVVAGRPVISWYNSFNYSYDLMYSFSSTSTGMDPADWQTITVDSEGVTGRDSMIVEAGGSPAIAYRSDKGLSYARAVTTTGDNPADWRILQLETGYLSQSLSMAIVDGNPALSYVANEELKYARSSDDIGAELSDWRFATADSTTDVSGISGFTSLAVIDGRPAIAYYNDGTADLMFIWATNATGAGSNYWPGPITVDSAGNVGEDPCLAEINGQPAITYYDRTNGNLKYAIWF